MSTPGSIRRGIERQGSGIPAHRRHEWAYQLCRDKRVDSICLQELVAAFEALGEPPDTPGYRWLPNDERGWGCDIALRNHL